MTTGPGTGSGEEDNRPWFRVDTERAVTLRFKSEYAKSGYAPGVRIDTAEARELAEALESAAKALDGAV